jgi:hypothetical protein
MGIAGLVLRTGLHTRRPVFAMALGEVEGSRRGFPPSPPLPHLSRRPARDTQAAGYALERAEAARVKNNRLRCEQLHLPLVREGDAHEGKGAFGACSRLGARLASSVSCFSGVSSACVCVGVCVLRLASCVLRRWDRWCRRWRMDQSLYSLVLGSVPFLCLCHSLSGPLSCALSNLARWLFLAARGRGGGAVAQSGSGTHDWPEYEAIISSHSRCDGRELQPLRRTGSARGCARVAA